MKLAAGACCDKPSAFNGTGRTTRCVNCGMRQGVPDLPDLSKLGRLSQRQVRVVRVLALMGGKASVGAIAGRARMMPREAGVLLQSAGCILVKERAPHGRMVQQWTLPGGVVA